MNFAQMCNFFVVVAEFRTGKSPILVATDVAARGLGMFVNMLLISHCWFSYNASNLTT
jgi:hypothetical protein